MPKHSASVFSLDRMALVRFNEARSSKGRELLTHSGYEYSFEAVSKIAEGWEYWKCPTRPPYCPGRGCIETQWQYDEAGKRYKMGRVTKEHNHAPILGGHLVRESSERLRQEARNEYPTSSRNIIATVRSSHPADVRVASATSTSSMRWTYNYHRRKHQEHEGDVGLDALPTSNILVPDQLLERVIYNENLQGQRMIVFCSQFGIETLRNYRDEVAIDGTFESCPRGFAQLYTMSVIVDHCAIPCAYGLLISKTAASYRIFFDSIRAAVGLNWYPIRIMSDFEQAAISAAKAVFPNSQLSGCLFHFGQALFKRLQRLPNLLTQYNNNNDNMRVSLRSLQALSFVPTEFVYNYFCILMSTLEPTEELQELIMYFVKTWVGPLQILNNEEVLEADAGGAADGWIRDQIIALNLGHLNAIFPISLWNVTERVAEGLSRTNNSVEAWHGVWNAHLKGIQRLSPFCRKMVEEDKMWADRVADFQASPADGIRGPYEKRREKVIRQDNNLEAIVADFENRDPLQYLHNCAYHLHF